MFTANTTAVVGRLAIFVSFVIIVSILIACSRPDTDWGAYTQGVGAVLKEDKP